MIRKALILTIICVLLVSSLTIFQFAIPNVKANPEILGYQTRGATATTIENYIKGTKFSTVGEGIITNITVFLEVTATNKNVKCAVYNSTFNLLNSTETKDVPKNTNGWVTFDLLSPLSLSANAYYWLFVWGESGGGNLYIYYDTDGPESGAYKEQTFGTWDDVLTGLSVMSMIISIYATYDSFTPFEGWLSGWSYRKSCLIQNVTGAGVNYTVKIKLEYESGTDSGNTVYLNSHSRFDLADVRFVDNDEITLLSCWREEKTDYDYAIYWVKVLDSLSLLNQTIYVYYGNSDAVYPYLASEKAHGEATFRFFESFEGLNLGDLNGQNGWSGDVEADVQETTVKEGSQACQIGTSATQEIDHSVTVDNYRCFLMAYLRGNDLTSDYMAVMYIYEGTNPITAVELGANSKKHLRASAWDTIESASANTWYKFKIALPSASTHKIWIDDVEKSLANPSNYNNVVTAVNKIRLEHYSAGNYGYFDLVIVGNYVYPEPSILSWGNEESFVYIYTSTFYAETVSGYIKRSNYSYPPDIETKQLQASEYVGQHRNIPENWIAETRYPTANGAYNSWSQQPPEQADWECVDDAGDEDTTYIYSTVATQKDTFDSTDYPTGVTWGGIRISARAKRLLTGTTQLRIICRSGSTDYYSDAKTLTTSYADYYYFWETNPNTGTAWTTTTLNAMEFGVEVYSLSAGDTIRVTSVWVLPYRYNHTQYRGYISFPTYDLPDDAILKSATMSMAIQTDNSATDFDVKVYSGVDCWTDTSTLEWSDCDSYKGVLLNTAGAVLNTYYNLTLPIGDVTKTGRTQIKLNSSREGTEPTTTGEKNEYVIFYNYSNANYKPKLVVTYTAPPRFSKISMSNNKAGQSCTFSSFWVACNNISGYIFGWDNSGQWENEAWVNMSTNPASAWINVTRTLNSTDKLRIEWRFYVNDSAGYWQESPKGVLITNTASTLGFSSLISGTWYPHQRHIFYAEDLVWVAFANGTHLLYSTSSDGISWKEPISLKNIAVNNAAHSFWYNGTHVAWSYGVFSLVYRLGVPQADGTINWLTDENEIFSSGVDMADVCLDNSGYPWISYKNTTDYRPYVVKSDLNNGTWQTASGFPVRLNNSYYDMWTEIVVPYKNNQTMAFYDGDNNMLGYRIHNGTALLSESIVATNLCHETSYSIAVSQTNSSVVYLVYANFTVADKIYVWFTEWDGATWSTPYIIANKTYVLNAWYASPTISVDSDDRLYVLWGDPFIISPLCEYYYKIRGVNEEWGNRVTWATDKGIEGTPEDITARFSAAHTVPKGTRANMYLLTGTDEVYKAVGYASAGLMTPLEIGWNNFTVWSDDIGKTLEQICANIQFEGVDAVIVIKYNGTEYRYDYGYSANASEKILTASDELRIYCNTDGEWYHGYQNYNWFSIFPLSQLTQWIALASAIFPILASWSLAQSWTLLIQSLFSMDMSWTLANTWTLLTQSVFNILPQWDLVQPFNLAVQSISNTLHSWNLAYTWSILTETMFTITTSLSHSFEWLIEIVVTKMYAVDITWALTQTWTLLIASVFAVLPQWNFTYSWTLLTEAIFNLLSSWGLTQSWNILIQVAFNITTSLSNSFQWLIEVLEVTGVQFYSVDLAWSLSQSWALLTQSIFNLLPQWNLTQSWTLLTQSIFNLLPQWSLQQTWTLLAQTTFSVGLTLQNTLTWTIEFLTGVIYSVDLQWLLSLQWLTEVVYSIPTPLNWGLISIGIAMIAFVLAAAALIMKREEG